MFKKSVGWARILFFGALTGSLVISGTLYAGIRPFEQMSRSKSDQSKPQKQDSKQKPPVSKPSEKKAPPIDKPNRERVTIVRGNVVTYTGAAIRGATVCIESPDSPLTKAATDSAHLTFLRNKLKLNTIRIKVETVAVLEKPEAQFPDVDKVVDFADRAGMYVLITPSDEKGRYSKDSLEAFWKAFAPRYKDRKHVFYELADEPVFGTATAFAEGEIKDMKGVFDIIRRGAPKTHVVLWSFSSLDEAEPTSTVCKEMNAHGDPEISVSYSEESVGYHHYSANRNEAATIRDENSLPIFCTQLDSQAKQEDDLIYLGELETARISWIHGAGTTSEEAENLLKNIFEPYWKANGEWRALPQMAAPSVPGPRAQRN